MSELRRAIQEDPLKDTERRLLVQSTTSEFLSFCRDDLRVPESTIQDFKKHSDPVWGIKREHILRAYRPDKEGFIRKNLREVGGIMRGFPENAELPDLLPTEYVNCLIKHAAECDMTWQQFAENNLGVQVSKTDMVVGEKRMPEEQRRSLLSLWISEQEVSAEEAWFKLRQLFYDRRIRKALPGSSVEEPRAGF